MEKCTVENEKSTRSDYGIILLCKPHRNVNVNDSTQRLNESFSVFDRKFSTKIVNETCFDRTHSMKRFIRTNL